MPLDPDEESLPGSAQPQPKPTTPPVASVATNPGAASPGATSPGATVPGKSPAAPALAWGVAGVLHEVGDLKAFPGARGVIRYVADGVQYQAPPLRDGLWKAVPGQSDTYELPWPDPPASVRTLESFRQSLEDAARAGQLRQASDPLLRELDQIADRLLETAEMLHRAQWTVGLLQPRNILFKTVSEETRPVLVDLGYFWKGGFGPPPWDASPGKPAWLDSAATEWLYDVSPVRQQIAHGSETSFPPAQAVTDVRLLARLLAWLISGRKDADVRVPRQATAEGLWQVLSAAAAGRIASVREFREALRENPLSEHFVDPVVLSPTASVVTEAPRSSMAPLVAGVVVVLLALGGTGAYLAGFFDGPKEVSTITTNSTNPGEVPEPGLTATTKPTSATTAAGPTPTLRPIDRAQLQAMLDQLQQSMTKKDITQIAKNIVELQKLGTLSPEDQRNVDAQRDQFLNLWVKEYQRIVKLGANPIERFNALEQLKTLENQLKQMIAEAPSSNPELQQKEQECLEFTATLARQLGSSP